MKSTGGPAEVKIGTVAIETILGKPFSTGVLEVKFEPGHGPIIYPDQQLFFDATDQRAHYVTFERFYQQNDTQRDDDDRSASRPFPASWCESVPSVAIKCQWRDCCKTGHQAHSG